MKIKIVIKILSVLTIVFFIFICYKFSTFTLFDDELIIVAEINHPPYKLKIYQMPSNAVTNASIQVRRVINQKEEVLSSFDNYDKLDSFEIRNDTLFLSLKGGNNSGVPFLAKVRL